MEITNPDPFQPPIRRIEAFRPVPDKYPHGGGGGLYGVYLRMLDQQLVWLVAIHTPSGPSLRITAVDAYTGSIVEDGVFALENP